MINTTRELHIKKKMFSGKFGARSVYEVQCAHGALLQNTLTIKLHGADARPQSGQCWTLFWSQERNLAVSFSCEATVSQKLLTIWLS